MSQNLFIKAFLSLSFPLTYLHHVSTTPPQVDYFYSPFLILNVFELCAKMLFYLHNRFISQNANIVDLNTIHLSPLSLYCFPLACRLLLLNAKMLFMGAVVDITRRNVGMGIKVPLIFPLAELCNLCLYGFRRNWVRGISRSAVGISYTFMCARW